MPDFNRIRLHHEIPSWVEDGSTYFITINAAPRERNQLAMNGVAETVFSAVETYHTLELWQVQLLLLMPDHLHALMAFNTRKRSMSKTVRSWKAWLTKHAAIHWQDGFFDHRIRNADEQREKAAYILPTTFFQSTRLRSACRLRGTF